MRRNYLIGCSLLFCFLLSGTACKFTQGERVRVPIPIQREPADTGSGAEREKQSAHAAESLPPPPVTLPPAKPLPPPVPPRKGRNSKAAKKEVPPVSSTEQTAVPPSVTPNPSPLQLAPDIPEKEKQDLVNKINSEINSARYLLDHVNKSRSPNTLSPEQNTTISTINDFLVKSDDARKRGDFYQAYAMAQKANILAASLAKQ
jgi:hypothetical protein